MEAVRQVVDGNSLSKVISLPEFFQNRKVEVIVFLPEEKNEMSLLPKRDIDALLTGSITESLIGALPDSGRSLENYRAERLGKYESVV